MTPGARPTDEKWCATLLDALPDAVAVIEGDGRLRYANPAAARLAGYAWGTPRGGYGFDRVHPDDLDKVLAAAETDDDGSRRPVAIRLGLADGRWLAVEAVTTNRLADGDLGGVILSIGRVLPQRKRRAADRSPDRPQAGAPDATSSALRAELERGFRTEAVEVHYQPVVETATGWTVGLEALARWHHPTLGLLRPGEFLGVAEQMGVASDLDACVLERVAVDRARWHTEAPGLVDLPLSVNISVAADLDHELDDRLDAYLSSPGGAGTRLHLELTEQALLAEAERLSPALERLRAKGVGLTVDASALGYSALPHLHRLPVRIIKLDHSALAATVRNGPEFTAAFADLYEALDVHVVAVGVETVDQHQLVRTAGIKWAQGYYYSEPRNPTALAALVTGRPAAPARPASAPEPPEQPPVDVDLSVSSLVVREQLERGFRVEAVEVHYQPVVDASTGRAVGLEALARWRHTTLGLLRPSEFLPVAEQMGLTAALDACVLERLALDRARWRTDAPQLVDLPVSVNVALGAEFGPDLEARLDAFLGSPGGAGTDLHLELTEQALLADLDTLAPELERLHARGIGLTVDASAVGYAALPHLHRLPVRIIKLDRAALSPTAAGTADFTAAFVELYEALNAHVVAVGVETFSQHQLVRAAGIKWAQGYFYAEPRDATELAMLASAPSRDDDVPSVAAVSH